ncbi:MAG: hypothetical protein DCF20_02435 [Pseudanabaena sp.]|nr:MAG: hypothetical protein DCF20_02435 [Pseudanabaena sp.]
MKINYLTASLASATLTLGLLASSPFKKPTDKGATISLPPANAEPVKEEKLELLFVQNSVSGTFDGKTLTLNGIGPTIFFTDRPKRVAGQVHTKEFVSNWFTKGADNSSFEVDPPNATLSIFGKDKVNSAVIELRNPKLVKNTLTYNVKILKGDLPKSFQESSLFIDIYGRWAAFGAGVALSRRNSYYYNPPAAYYPAPYYSAPYPYY